MGNGILGEFEQVVLLAILRKGEEAFGLEVRREIEASTDRTVSRSAFYTTLERLERKGLVRWEERQPEDSRRSAPLRRFELTPEGMGAIRSAGQTWRTLWDGLEEILEDA